MIVGILPSGVDARCEGVRDIDLSGDEWLCVILKAFFFGSACLPVVVDYFRFGPSLKDDPSIFKQQLSGKCTFFCIRFPLKRSLQNPQRIMVNLHNAS